MCVQEFELFMNHPVYSTPPLSQPLVPRENITAWMNAIGLVITALPVRRSA